MLFRKNKKTEEKKTFDPALFTPAMRCSICTGEQTAGFREKSTGKFVEVMLIRSKADLQAFREEYGVSEIEKFY